jgi:hypothetical protein
MLTLSLRTEALIKAKAKASGKTPDEVVGDALLHVASVLPWRRPGPPPATGTKEDFFAALEEIAKRGAARPVVDLHSPDEIIGYDDFSLPR